MAGPAQELAVARLVAARRPTKKTAQELYISVKTVLYHLTHIYSELGIRSRSDWPHTSRSALEQVGIQVTDT